MLQIEDIDCYYEDFQALRKASLTIEEGMMAALLGPNAAGKTTTLCAVSGLTPCTSGRIRYEGREIQQERPEQIVDLGIAHVPEGRKLFNTLTVRENLELGAYTKRARPRMKENLEKVYDLFPVLGERFNQMAGNLSGGEQQMCAIARGLMASPRLLMIDEMSLGLSPILVKRMFEMVQTIAAEGITILMVEQQVNHALQIANTAYIMEKGSIVLSGPSREIACHEHVRKVYLGM